ncbi:antigen 5 like allergen Cul n 1-like [Ochlerotatus camptorhynchus]|uniref:antigen 5 like allergen Cul n 1-like n=1 Tax=Ochlerotatus camptorhynchus TaxID=644619 RepID=UPI0031CFBB4B
MAEGIVLTLVVLTIQQDTNYCEDNLCRFQKPHIACNASSSFEPECGPEAYTVMMNSSNKALIINLHNQYRSKIARGKQNFTSGGFLPPAVRMPTIQWDDELAYIAAANTRRCIFKHDNCRNTAQLMAVGQNLAWISYYGMVLTDADLITQMINNWYGEYAYVNPKIIKRYPRDYQGPALGHFTAMVADRSDRIGCAMISFEDSPWLRKYLVCNYSITNIFDQPVYKMGITASKCATGQNPEYPGLCSVNEEINSNPF